MWRAADLGSVGCPHDVSLSADGAHAHVASENNARIYDGCVSPSICLNLPTLDADTGQGGLCLCAHTSCAQRPSPRSEIGKPHDG